MKLGSRRLIFYLALGLFLAWVGFLAAMAATSSRRPTAKVEPVGQPD